MSPKLVDKPLQLNAEAANRLDDARHKHSSVVATAVRPERAPLRLLCLLGGCTSLPGRRMALGRRGGMDDLRVGHDDLTLQDRHDVAAGARGVCSL